jgi:selenide,water dikinase
MAGDLLLLTKPLGVGILTTAQKRGQLKDEHLPLLLKQLTKLNAVGALLGKIEGVNAMTDVTGFGLLGHLIEMAEGSGLSSEIYYDKIPVLTGVRESMAQRIFPDATTRNWSSYSEKVKFEKGVNVMEAFTLLPDPQTNGGLLISVSKDALQEVVEVLSENGLSAHTDPIGKLMPKEEKTVVVKN